MKVIQLDDLNPDSKRGKLLLSLLQQPDPDRFGWGAGKHYKIPYKNKVTKIKLDSTIIKRPSKKGGFRYDVIDTVPLGEGGFGTVYPVKMTYKIENDRLEFKKKPLGKRRIVKVMACTDPETLDKAIVEYKMMKLTPHLFPKGPVLYNDFIYMTSRRLEGVSLFDLIENDLSGQKPLSLEERFRLSIRLMEAVHNQVIAKDMVHRDLKPENMIVDLESDSVGTIDYGFAKFYDEITDNEAAGSELYAAPEVFLNVGTDQRSDIYSLGRILGLIWHNDLELYAFGRGYDVILRNAKNPHNHDKLFENINGLDPEVENIIRQTLINMTAFNKEERCDFTNAYEALIKAHEIQLNKENIRNKTTEIKVNTAPLKNDENFDPANKKSKKWSCFFKPRKKKIDKVAKHSVDGENNNMPTF
ncbi:MAG TPA: protein kinase [Legionella sp.]|nr:protein kinase [Legionella sp.]